MFPGLRPGDLTETGVARHRHDSMRVKVKTLITLASILAISGFTAAASANPGADFGAAEQAFVESLIDALEGGQGEFHSLTVEEAVAEAVANNPGLSASRRLPQAARHGVLEAASAYEPVISIDAGLSRNKVPTDNALAGNQVLETKKRWGDVVISKLLVSGASVDLTWANERRSTNSSFQGLNPEYDPTLDLSVEQPLLRDIGGISTRTSLRLARNTGAQAVAAFEAAMAQFVAEVTMAYWDHARAEVELEVHRRSLELARQLVTEAEAKVEVGLLAPVAVREAGAEAAAREEAAISAENRLELASRKLQYLVMLASPDSRAPLRLKPSSRHQPAVVAVDKAASMRQAVESRPELRAARLAVEAAALAERQARNQLLPSLDLVGNYTLVGLAGNSAPVTPIGGGATVESPFSGSYSDAVDLMMEGDFFKYSLGLTLEVPLSNTAARAAHARAVVELQGTRDSLKQAAVNVALEVERAAGNVDSAYRRVTAARLARELSDENLANQQRRFEIGMVTTKDVLDFQAKLAGAMAAEARAVNDHADALTSLLLARGALLGSYGIEVEMEGAPGLPWWSRF